MLENRGKNHAEFASLVLVNSHWPGQGKLSKIGTIVIHFSLSELNDHFLFLREALNCDETVFWKLHDTCLQGARNVWMNLRKGQSQL